MLELSSYHDCMYADMKLQNEKLQEELHTQNAKVVGEMC